MDDAYRSSKSASTKAHNLRTESQCAKSVVRFGIKRPGVQLDVPDTTGARFVQNAFDEGSCHPFSSKLRGHADLVYFAVHPPKTERVLGAIIGYSQRIARRQAFSFRDPCPAIGIPYHRPEPFCDRDGLGRFEALRNMRDMQFLNEGIQIRQDLRVALFPLSNCNDHESPLRVSFSL